MGLYLGTSDRLKINLNHNIYSMYINSIIDIIKEEDVLIKDIDGNILQDINKNYLLSAEEEI